MELTLFQEWYSYLALILVVVTFLIVWYKKDNALFALSIASGVLALTILASPFNDYIVSSFYLKLNGEWRLYQVTAYQLKIVFTVLVVVGVLAINGIFRKLGILRPYGRMKGSGAED